MPRNILNEIDYAELQRMYLFFYKTGTSDGKNELEELYVKLGMAGQILRDTVSPNYSSGS